MKIKTISILVLALGFLLSGNLDLSGQDESARSREESKKEDQLEKEMARAKAAEKEALARQEKAMLRQAEAFSRQEEEMARKEAHMVRQMEVSERALDTYTRNIHFSHQNSSQLMLSKTYEGTDAENTGEFHIEESVRQIKISIDGVVKEGSIKIKLLLPGGETFKDLTIDESADIRYSQSLGISEEEKKYYGKWKYIIKASKAKGNYRMSISTN
jgi:hypothetical protein